MRRLLVAFALTLTACASDAPPLPSTTDQAAAVELYKGTTCPALRRRLAELNDQLTRLEERDRKRHGDNEMYSFIGNIAAPAAVMSSSNDHANERRTHIVHERDGIDAAIMARQCP